MVIDMNETRLTTIAQIEEFLSGSGQIEFTPSGGDLERYAHISRVLKRFDYPRLGKRDKGMVLPYLRHTSGYSRQQLTRSAGYQAQRVSFTKTHPVCNPIGVRRAPLPDGRAGFVRIDTVHQGDLDGVKGIYHITCVDAVCQWQLPSLCLSHQRGGAAPRPVRHHAAISV